MCHYNFYVITLTLFHVGSPTTLINSFLTIAISGEIVISVTLTEVLLLVTDGRILETAELQGCSHNALQSLHRMTQKKKH